MGVIGRSVKKEEETDKGQVLTMSKGCVRLLDGRKKEVNRFAELFDGSMGPGWDSGSRAEGQPAAGV